MYKEYFIRARFISCCLCQIWFKNGVSFTAEESIKNLSSRVKMELSLGAILFLVGFVLSCFFIIFPKEVTIGKKKTVINLDYSTVPICVVLILFITTSIPWVVIVRGLLGANSPEWAKDETNSSYLVPYTVVILFMTLAYVCTSAENTKVFIVIANLFSKQAMKSSNPSIVGLSLFTLLAAIFTLVTSNDIVVLTLTPIILQFSKKTDRRMLLALLLAEFCSANSFSAGLLSGNPSNIIVCSVFGIDFTTYMKYLLIPAILSGCGVFVYSVILARSDLSKPDNSRVTVSDVELVKIPAKENNENDRKETPVPVGVTTNDSISEKKEAAVTVPSNDDIPMTANSYCSLVILVLLFCLFLFSTSIQQKWPFVEFWHIAVVVFVISLIKDVFFYFTHLRTIWEINTRLPWKVPLFLFAMFILVETASYYGFTSWLASGFAKAIVGPVAKLGRFPVAFVFCVITCLACIVFNNLPATIFITRIISDSAVKEVLGDQLWLATFSIAAGTNFGACILPHASLAGLMWSSLVKNNEILKRVWKHGAVVCLLLVVICSIALSVMSSFL